MPKQLSFEHRLARLYLDVIETFADHTHPDTFGVCPTDGRCDALNEQLNKMFADAFPPDKAWKFYPAAEDLLDVRFDERPAGSLREAFVNAFTTDAQNKVFPDDHHPADPRGIDGNGA